MGCLAKYSVTKDRVDEITNRYEFNLYFIDFRLSTLTNNVIGTSTITAIVLLCLFIVSN